MSGVETTIRYETAGTPKVVTNMMAVIAGVPIRVINKARPIGWTATGFNKQGGGHEYVLKGDHSIFNGLVTSKVSVLGWSLYIDDTIVGSANAEGVNEIEIKPAVGETPAVKATLTPVAIGTNGTVMTIPEGAITNWTAPFAVSISMIILDKSIYEPKTVYNIDSLVKLFGHESVANPVSNLAYGSSMYMQGAVDKAFKIIPVLPADVSGLSLEGILDNSEAWAKATKDFMEVSNDTYHIVPLTNNKTVLNTLVKDIEENSAPGKKKEFRMYCSHRIFTDATEYDECNNPIDVLLFSDACSDVFLRGRSVIFKETEYADYPMSFKRMLNDADKKKAFNLEAKKAPANLSYSHRATNIFPSYFSLKEGAVRLPGYMVAARICGERDSSALSTSFTLRPYAWISTVPTCEVYKLSEFEQMVAYGNHVIVQENENAIAKCYGENTAHNELLEKAGENYVVSVDYLARRIRDHLIKYIANGNDNKISDNSSDPATAKYLQKVNASLDYIKHELITEKEVFSFIEISQITIGDGITIARNRLDFTLRVRLYYTVDEIKVTIVVV